MSETPKRPLGAQLSHALRARGVDTIFGIPGVHNQELYRGIEEAGITHVLARHEQGAGFMADGYARATGRPGVCYVITGPGLTNALTPLGQAYSDSVPVLCIASCLDDVAATRGQLHQMRDQAGAARAVCDWSETALSAGAAYALIDRAFMEFATSRPRPKAIHVPIGVLEADALPAPPARAVERRATLADGRAIAEVRRLLERAHKPLFIFGGGVRDAGLVSRVLEETEAASFTTYAGRGLVAKGAPLHFGAFLARPSSADILAQADLIVAVGTELSEGDLWRDALGHGGTLVRVDTAPEVLADRHRADVQLLHDGDTFLAALGDTERAASAWDAARVREMRQIWRAEVDAERPGILRVADALRAALPPATMIYSDMTQFAYSAKEVWEMDRPGHWHHPTGFGTLGYALPAAIGGTVARRGLPTMAIAGDYGFQYTLQELGAA
ncbi:MAG: thiamine pyrophosphate-binding protein, partial [Pseudomonadota bacterium]